LTIKAGGYEVVSSQTQWCGFKSKDKLIEMIGSQRMIFFF
jgi:hypothetical protein